MIRFLFLILLSFISTSLSASLSFIPEFEKKLIAAQKLTKLPGFAIAIIKDKDIIYAKGFGTKKVGFDAPINTDTLFQIGSVTKGFTAALIAKLMTEGKLDWNKRVQKLYPPFMLSYKHHTEELTLKDVLAQRSGLPLYAGDEFIQQGKDYLFVLNKFFSTYRKLDKIGEHFSYQNSLYCVTEPALIHETKKDWHRAIQEDFLIPLGIENASTSYQAITFNPNATHPHEMRNGKMQRIPRSHFGYRVAPAGGLNMNIKDLSRYLIFHINQGEGLISPLLMKELHSPQVPTNIKMTNYKRHYFPKERVNSSAYCLGLRQCDWNGHNVICHGGALNGQISSITFLPDKRIGLAILSNAKTALNPIAHKYFLDMALGLEPIDWLKKYQEQKKPEAKKITPTRKKPQKIAKKG